MKRLRSDGQKLRKELATFEQVRGKDGSFAGPLDRLDFMSDQARARYTAAVLDMVSGDDASWTVVHATNPASFPRLQVASPVSWRLRRAGRVTTSLGVRKTSMAVAPRFKALAELLPVADCSPEQAAFLRLPSTPDRIPDAIWELASEKAASCQDDRALGAFVAAIVEAGQRPQTIRCRVGTNLNSSPPTR